MEKRTESWRSPSLGRDMAINIYGDSGTPILALPTRGQKAGQWEEHGMVDALSFQLDSGFNQLYCLDSIDDESLLNEKIGGDKRILIHQQYEAYVMEEAVPFVKDANPIDFLIVAGVDFGGYHAVNFALKHPEDFGRAIGMSGIYDIKSFMDGFYDDNVYYNNPVDYLPNLNNHDLLRKIHGVDFRLVSYKNDSRREDARRLSDVFKTKFIPHELDIWELESDREWDLWNKMIQTHII